MFRGKFERSWLSRNTLATSGFRLRGTCVCCGTVKLLNKLTWNVYTKSRTVTISLTTQFTLVDISRRHLSAANFSRSTVNQKTPNGRVGEIFGLEPKKF